MGRCDVIAEGIIAAAKELNLSTPIVVRLQGTKVDEGKILLSSSGLKILAVSDFEEAARLVTKVSKIVEIAKDAKIALWFGDKLDSQRIKNIRRPRESAEVVSI